MSSNIKIYRNRNAGRGVEPYRLVIDNVLVSSFDELPCMSYKQRYLFSWHPEKEPMIYDNVVDDDDDDQLIELSDLPIEAKNWVLETIKEYQSDREFYK